MASKKSALLAKITKKLTTSISLEKLKQIYEILNHKAKVVEPVVEPVVDEVKPEISYIDFV